MIAIIFDFNRTIYDPDSKGFCKGALECLQHLSGKHALYLVVKGGDERKELIESLRIKQYFKSVSVQPEKSVEQFIACKEDCPPDTTWYVVGDRVKKEIRYGNECGMKTIWYKSGKFAEEEPSEEIEKPDVTISDLSELKEIIV